MRASKKDTGKVLDGVAPVTGWSRHNARRRRTGAAKRPPGSGRQVAKKPRKPRSPKYSYDSVKVLQRVWAASGGLCGKYLAASMRTQLDGLERLAKNRTEQLYLASVPPPYANVRSGIRIKAS